ncbi:hypothetical protein MASR1M66_15670 [Aminivibrio sp.]
MDSLNGYGDIFYRNTIARVSPDLHHRRPHGGRQSTAPPTDFIFMVEGTG